METINVKEDLTRPTYRRIARDLKEVWGKYKIEFEDDSVLSWRLYLNGIEGTPYEGGVFELSIVFPIDYPFRPPRIKFITQIFNASVDEEGKLCLMILGDEWSPAVSVEKIIRTIQSLMIDPSPDKDHLVVDIAEMYKTDLNKFNEIAREWTKLYALPKFVTDQLKKLNC